ncbi:mycothiol maleylpyruvate isomerase-like protein [Nonomuraea polychroma]|uniref:Mycothiol maleylpyruvate isomerase-like protein n=2 Tax=Nonomuraea polychroma TaxID=46176 RepID=A0A438MNA8_9ACTN|nr:mycothiol maleylpyruvate isomerase-like protein [Nonomuraea polychroma]
MTDTPAAGKAPSLTPRKVLHGSGCDAQWCIRTLAQARAALRDVVPSLVTLVRSVPDANTAGVGTWTVGDVAAHLSHVFRFDTDAVAGRPVPDAMVTMAGMAEANATMLAEDGERDPAVLADRIGTLANKFDDVASRSRAATVDWLQGARLPPSAVACHLLEECLIHGHDIATATGRPWPIQRHHALLAVEGAALPLIAALPPTAFLNQEKAGSFRARFELRLRGGGRTVLNFDGGSLTLDAAGTRDVDAHISADPPALMLVFIGRQAIWKPLLGGKLAAWGRRPWKLAHMLTAISPP